MSKVKLLPRAQTRGTATTTNGSRLGRQGKRSAACLGAGEGASEPTLLWQRGQKPATAMQDHTKSSSSCLTSLKYKMVILVLAWTWWYCYTHVRHRTVHHYIWCRRGIHTGVQTQLFQHVQQLFQHSCNVSATKLCGTCYQQQEPSTAKCCRCSQE